MNVKRLVRHVDTDNFPPVMNGGARVLATLRACRSTSRG